MSLAVPFAFREPSLPPVAPVVAPSAPVAVFPVDIGPVAVVWVDESSAVAS